MAEPVSILTLSCEARANVVPSMATALVSDATTAPMPCGLSGHIALSAVLVVMSYRIEPPACNVKSRSGWISKDELVQAVWPDTVVSDGVLTVCLAELRKALGDTPQPPHYIETVSRRGYRWIGRCPPRGHPPPQRPRRAWRWGGRSASSRARPASARPRSSMPFWRAGGCPRGGLSAQGRAAPPGRGRLCPRPGRHTADRMAKRPPAVSSRPSPLARHQQARALGAAGRHEPEPAVAAPGQARRRRYDLLAPIYGWFTEGFDTADLQEARALLEEWA